MINPAPGFWPIFGPLGPTAGPGSPGNGPGSKNSAAYTKTQPRISILSPMCWHFVQVGCLAFSPARLYVERAERGEVLPELREAFR